MKKNKKGQAAVEYILSALFLFAAFVLFYGLYSRLVPRQFDQGAQVILSVYEPKDT